MKEEMERIWKEENVACPCHLVVWRTDQIGYSDKSEWLTYTKGSKR